MRRRLFVPASVLLCVLLAGCTQSGAPETAGAEPDSRTEQPISTVPPATDCEQVSNALTSLKLSLQSAFSAMGEDPEAAGANLKTAADAFAEDTKGIGGDAEEVANQVTSLLSTLQADIEAATDDGLDVEKLGAAASEFSAGVIAATEECVDG